MSKHRVVIGLLLGLASTLLGGCGSGGSDEEPVSSPPSAATRTYVGNAQGTAAFVAVVVDGSRAVAYVCDGMPGEPTGTVPTIQAWFGGESDGRAIDVEQPAGRLQADLTETAMSGTLTLADGRRIPVLGQAVEGNAGLYRAESTGDGLKGVAGWILAADGEQRGGLFIEGGGGVGRSSGTQTLNLSQLTFTGQGLATARISKVGITPIPIP